MSMKPDKIDTKYVEMKPLPPQINKEPDTPPKFIVQMAPEGSNKTETENKPSPMPAKSLSEDDKKIINEQKAALQKALKEEKENNPIIDKRQFEA